MSLHQHSILKTKTYQQQELTKAQHSEDKNLSTTGAYKSTAFWRRNSSLSTANSSGWHRTDLSVCWTKFIHTCRQFYNKYRTFLQTLCVSNFFAINTLLTSYFSELFRWQSGNDWKWHHIPIIYHCTTLSYSLFSSRLRSKTSAGSTYTLRFYHEILI